MKEVHLALRCLFEALLQPDVRVAEDAIVGLLGCGLYDHWQAWTYRYGRRKKNRPRGGFLGLGVSMTTFSSRLSRATQPWEIEPWEVTCGRTLWKDRPQNIAATWDTCWSILTAKTRRWEPYRSGRPPYPEDSERDALLARLQRGR